MKKIQKNLEDREKEASLKKIMTIKFPEVHDRIILELTAMSKRRRQF